MQCFTLKKPHFFFPLNYLACTDFEELPFCFKFCLNNTRVQMKVLKLLCMHHMTAMSSDLSSGTKI